MQLPENSIGPTDIIQYGDCPRRFDFGMRRHTDAGEAPEATNPDNAYGSAFHEAVAYAEQHDAGDDEAIQHAFDRYGRWLDPEDLTLLKADLEVYRRRDPTGVRLIAVEQEIRVPLFVHDGVTIYLRGKIDRLYQRIDNPSVFIHVDYKTSKHKKAAAEVHSDVQLWTYNLGIHEVYPECETLVQLYDQLRFGVEPTRKSAEQREEIREWLIKRATTILTDTELKPTHNDWCAWCPIMESCPVVDELSDFALARIAVLAPAEKHGRKTVVNLDPAKFDIYVDELEKVGNARKVLDRFDESVRDALHKMPSTRRRELGYDLSPRGKDVWPPEAMRAMHDVLGEDFYEVVSVSKTRAEGRLGGDERLTTVLEMAVREEGTPVLKKVA